MLQMDADAKSLLFACHMPLVWREALHLDALLPAFLYSSAFCFSPSLFASCVLGLPMLGQKLGNKLCWNCLLVDVGCAPVTSAWNGLGG